LLFWGVLPAWRGQGIERQLLQQAISTARQLGWQQMTIGPMKEGISAVSLLEAVHATPRQSYRLYEWYL
jgi:GNAT superfamily N-acetyltransferase